MDDEAMGDVGGVASWRVVTRFSNSGGMGVSWSTVAKGLRQTGPSCTFFLLYREAILVISSFKMIILKGYCCERIMIGNFVVLYVEMDLDDCVPKSIINHFRFNEDIVLVHQQRRNHVSAFDIVEGILKVNWYRPHVGFIVNWKVFNPKYIVSKMHSLPSTLSCPLSPDVLLLLGLSCSWSSRYTSPVLLGWGLGMGMSLCRS